MKYIIILFLIFTEFLPLKVNSQAKQRGYVLSCVFDGLPDKVKVYLTTQEGDTVQRALSVANRVIFKGSLNAEGRFHFIKFDTLITSVGTEAIFIRHKPINIQGIIGNRKVKVFGSLEQYDWEKVKKKSEGVTKVVDDFEKKWSIRERERQDSISRITYLTEDEKQILLNSAYDEMVKSSREVYAEFTRNWLRTNMESFICPYLLRFYLSCFEREEAEGLYHVFSNDLKNSYYGKALKIDIEAMSLGDGSIIPNFLFKSIDGDTVRLHDFIKNSKYTLIDCWASWCKPCRAEIPKLKEVYNKFKEKGLNLLGISSDMKVADWKKAVLDDKTTWLQMREMDGNLSKAFNLKAIPAYILIDKQGKLIAFDCVDSSVKNFGGSLRGENLEKKLEELLGK